MNMLNRDLGAGDICDNIGIVGVSAKWSYVIVIVNCTILHFLVVGS